jgi:hypothetical protein
MKRADVKKDIARVFSQAGFQGKGLEWKYSGKDCDAILSSRSRTLATGTRYR